MRRARTTRSGPLPIPAPAQRYAAIWRIAANRCRTTSRDWHSGGIARSFPRCRRGGGHVIGLNHERRQPGGQAIGFMLKRGELAQNRPILKEALKKGFGRAARSHW